jgi:hypothetical protein
MTEAIAIPAPAVSLCDACPPELKEACAWYGCPHVADLDGVAP